MSILYRLICKEFKYVFENVTFYLFFMIVLLFYFTQFSPPGLGESLEPQPPGQGEKAAAGTYKYGLTDDSNHMDEMVRVYNNMEADLGRGAVTSYETIIAKQVRLDESRKSALREAMKQLAPDGRKDGKLKITVSYPGYLKIVRNLDTELGGGTLYGDDYRKMFSQKARTYEEALADFNNMLVKDRLTNAYAREFADYMGITAGFFPVFIAAFLLTRDKRNRMHELVYSRGIRSISVVFARFAALVSAMLLCYLVPAAHATWVFFSIGGANGYSIDLLAFFKYILVWVLPTILFSVSSGMLVSTVFGNGIIAIPVQFVLWMSSMMPLEGNYSLLKYVIRFNRLGGYELYMQWLGAIRTNRLFYTAVSMMLLLLTTYIWSLGRCSGDAFFGRLFKRFQVQRKNTVGA